MSIKIAITGSPPIVIDENEITLGSAASCTFAFLNHRDIKPKHAVIRLLAGRWLVEAREGEAIYVGSSEPKRLQWLKPNDVILLSPLGPSVTFQPDDDAPPKLSSPSHVSVAVPLPLPDRNPTPVPPDSDSHETFRLQKSPSDSIPVITTPAISAPVRRSTPSTDEVPILYPPASGSSASLPTTGADSSYGLKIEQVKPAEYVPIIVDIDEPDPAPEAKGRVLLPRISFDSNETSENTNSTDADEPAVDPEVTWLGMLLFKFALGAMALWVLWMAINELKK